VLLRWVVLVVSVLTVVHGSPFLDKKKKKCTKVTINKVSNQQKCYGLPDRLVCTERYKQVCEDVVTKDSRVECKKEVVADHDTEVCETELINQCHTTHTTVYENQCSTVNKLQCYEGYGSYGGGYSAPIIGNNGGSSPATTGEDGGGKKKGKKGRRKRGVLQAILLQNALNQRHPIRVTTTPAPATSRPYYPAPPQPVCYNVPERTCKKVGVDKPETHCEEVEGEKLCTRTPNYREVQTCKNVEFDVPSVSCRHMPWKVCENAPNRECHSARVINRGVGHRKVCS